MPHQPQLWRLSCRTARDAAIPEWPRAPWTIFDGGPCQFKLYGSQAYRLTDKFLVMGDVEVLLSRGNDFTVSQENIRITPDFDILKTTLNFGYEFSPNFALYAGGFSDLWNRNISVGKGWQIFSVIKL